MEVLFPCVKDERAETLCCLRNMETVFAHSLSVFRGPALSYKEDPGMCVWRRNQLNYLDRLALMLNHLIAAATAFKKGKDDRYHSLAINQQELNVATKVLLGAGIISAEEESGVPGILEGFLEVIQIFRKQNGAVLLEKKERYLNLCKFLKGVQESLAWTQRLAEAPGI